MGMLYEMMRQLRMKRERIELVDIAAWDNLQLAVWKAARGKHSRTSVASFYKELNTHLEQLQNDILTAKVPYGNYRAFTINDPKRRVIHAASFADRVLHHAIMNLAEPIFERSLVDSTYACRPGKGVHLAVAQVQRNLQRFPWFVQVDIEHYFPSVDHERLSYLLLRRFKGEDLLYLFARIVNSYQSSPGKGLPIGSLTSQHFANYYLNDADRFLLKHSDVCAHVRYMDDIIWWCRDKSSAKAVLQIFEEYVNNVCQLKLKSTVRLNRSTSGVTYCGFRIFPGVVRLTRRKQRRYRFLRQYYEKLWQRGQIEERNLQKAYDSVLAATLPAQSRSWRQRDLQLHSTLYDNAHG
ncbi:Reverse transcriptase (RNA-dependent DNA polymerase) [Nitrosomonas aestuarii]|uniref:Reverse transcriptase (RNA-dependent DNA polymerase) n=2 Tax=Nitrosomonas aestuarii TaxID=52441 RepID=A0A1I4E783_9PROT|nr:Reverse transcriptase (RNA-dependent DNA polymerase) [Nitrosomonas aestuarii]